MFIKLNKKSHGFTLLEVLIALFIFTIISMMLVNALHNVITIHSGTEKNAERLRALQIALLTFSRDVEQTVNRPVLNVSGKEDPAFAGSSTSVFFTHMGLADPTNAAGRSSLQRIGYVWHDDALWRLTFNVLDQAPQSQPHVRKLLADVTSASFEYLDNDKRFRSNWPTEGQAQQALPRAMRITLTISNWGTIKQTYVIAAKPTNAPPPPPKPPQT